MLNYTSDVKNAYNVLVRSQNSSKKSSGFFSLSHWTTKTPQNNNHITNPLSRRKFELLTSKHEPFRTHRRMWRRARCLHKQTDCIFPVRQHLEICVRRSHKHTHLCLSLTNITVNKYTNNTHASYGQIYAKTCTIYAENNLCRTAYLENIWHAKWCLRSQIRALVHVTVIIGIAICTS